MKTEIETITLRNVAPLSWDCVLCVSGAASQDWGGVELSQTRGEERKKASPCRKLITAWTALSGEVQHTPGFIRDSCSSTLLKLDHCTKRVMFWVFFNWIELNFILFYLVFPHAANGGDGIAPQIGPEMCHQFLIAFDYWITFSLSATTAARSVHFLIVLPGKPQPLKRRHWNRTKPHWSTVASLTSLHSRCPLAPSISRSVQRMRAQLATNQDEDRIVDHGRGGWEKKQNKQLDPGGIIYHKTWARSVLGRIQIDTCACLLLSADCNPDHLRLSSDCALQGCLIAIKMGK